MVPRARGGKTLELARQLPASEDLARPLACVLRTGVAGWAWVGVEAGMKVGRFLPQRTPDLV